MLLYITMNILPDVTYNVKGAAGPFEHLLTTKILNQSTNWCGLELVKQIKCKSNTSCNCTSFQYSYGGEGRECKKKGLIFIKVGFF